MGFNIDFTKLYKIGDLVLFDGLSATVKAVYVGSVIISFDHNPKIIREIDNPNLLENQY